MISEARPGLDAFEHGGEIAVERRMREMLAPDLMKIQAHFLDSAISSSIAARWSGVKSQ